MRRSKAKDSVEIRWGVIGVFIEIVRDKEESFLEFVREMKRALRYFRVENFKAERLRLRDMRLGRFLRVDMEEFRWQIVEGWIVK